MCFFFRIKLFLDENKLNNSFTSDLKRWALDPIGVSDESGKNYKLDFSKIHLEHLSQISIKKEYTLEYYNSSNYHICFSLEGASPQKHGNSPRSQNQNLFDQYFKLPIILFHWAKAEFKCALCYHLSFSHCIISMRLEYFFSQ